MAHNADDVEGLLADLDSSDESDASSCEMEVRKITRHTPLTKPDFLIDPDFDSDSDDGGDGPAAGGVSAADKMRLKKVVTAENTLAQFEAALMEPSPVFGDSGPTSTSTSSYVPATNNNSNSDRTIGNASVGLPMATEIKNPNQMFEAEGGDPRFPSSLIRSPPTAMTITTPSASASASPAIVSVECPITNGPTTMPPLGDCTNHHIPSSPPAAMSDIKTATNVARVTPSRPSPQKGPRSNSSDRGRNPASGSSKSVSTIGKPIAMAAVTRSPAKILSAAVGGGGGNSLDPTASGGTFPIPIHRRPRESANWVQRLHPTTNVTPTKLPNPQVQIRSPGSGDRLGRCRTPPASARGASAIPAGGYHQRVGGGYRSVSSDGGGGACRTTTTTTNAAAVASNRRTNSTERPRTSSVGAMKSPRRPLRCSGVGGEANATNADTDNNNNNNKVWSRLYYDGLTLKAKKLLVEIAERKRAEEEAEAKVTRECTFKPTITDAAKVVYATGGGGEDVYHRLNAIQPERKEEELKHIRRRVEEEQFKECTFHPNVHLRTPSKDGTPAPAPARASDLMNRDSAGSNGIRMAVVPAPGADVHFFERLYSEAALRDQRRTKQIERELEREQVLIKTAHMLADHHYAEREQNKTSYTYRRK